MARRIVFGRRSNGDFGLFISKPGYDAYSTGDGNLLFSPSLRRYMRIQSGTVTIPNSSSYAQVNFPTQGSVPLVFCGELVYKPDPFPVRVTIASSYFRAYAAMDADGNYPARGRTVDYVVVAKTV